MISILIDLHPFDESNIHSFIIHIGVHNKGFDRRNHVFLLALDHIHHIAGIVQHIGDLTDFCTIPPSSYTGSIVVYVKIFF